ncbi:hypothetical protein [Neogemmobacter tilapiae]|nr:hypothetical protein [Gemmobacter tilapiae]
MLGLLPCPTLADSVADHFRKGSGCHIRQYNAAHLAGHPEQTVTEIALNPSALPNEPGLELLDLFVQVKGRNYEYHALAYCEPGPKQWSCGLEGDGGRFILTHEKQGTLRLTVGKGGLGFEGAQDFLTLYGDRGDDRVFLIPSVPAELCQ